MKTSYLCTTIFCIAGLLTACGGSDNHSSEETEQTTDSLKLPDTGSSAFVQSFNLGSLWSSAFSNVNGFTVTVGGLTQTLHTSPDNGSWYVTWDGEYEGEMFNNWTAFGYEETPSNNIQSGHFYFYHYNIDVVASTLEYNRDGSIMLKNRDENGFTDSIALLVPTGTDSIRIVSRDYSEASATVIDLTDANGSHGVGYENCTADFLLLATDTSSCATAVAF